MANTTPSYWSLIWQRFLKNRKAKWAYRVLIGMLWVAILNPFIAGDVPIFTKTDGESHFPIFQEYLIDLGIKERTGIYLNSNYWHETEFDQAIYPMIPYSASYQDTKNIHYKSPFGPQNISEHQAWHWLGTDQLGRDVAASIIGGIRIALKVGILSMLIATFIGLLLGGLAGYYGDYDLKVPIATIILNLLGLFLAIHFAFISRGYQLSGKESDHELLKSIGIFLAILLAVNVFAKGLQRLPFSQKSITFPCDLLVMRTIEVLNSVPGLLLLIAFTALFSTQTIWPIILIIGFLNWTGVARFFRAELLKVRNLEYIQAAKALSYSDARILFRHALPNAIGPTLILVAFGIANAILSEATLSFLGIGSYNEITWGSLLSVRGTEANWWMALFPGLAIFVTILVFNLIGEGLKDAIDAKDI